jgi:hypothetical protein
MVKHDMRILPLLMLTATLSMGASPADPGRYDIPDHGSIRFAIPATWKEDFRQPVKKMPPTITWSPASGAAFRILITIGWQDDPAAALPSDAELKKRVEQSAEGVKPMLVEPSAAVKPLKGASASGYYFSATERTVKQGEYKYLTQGIVQVGKFVVPFTIFTNDGQQQVVDAALAALGGAAAGAAGNATPKQ